MAKKNPKTWTGKPTRHLEKSGKADTGFELLTNYPEENRDIIKRLQVNNLK
jgi:hypothetical protein